MVLQQRASQPPLVSSHSFTSVGGETRTKLIALPLKRQPKNKKFRGTKSSQTCLKCFVFWLKTAVGICVWAAKIERECIFLFMSVWLSFKYLPWMNLYSAFESVETVQEPGNSWELLRETVCVLFPSLNLSPLYQLQGKWKRKNTQYIQN